ncbi:HAMP domain-containing sensor histidine kinase [Anaerotignum lactatifermentans]|uniref:HAMP domain-containing sensor histidine kinase n=1 Tax=Anaerotignum lactatifermentans TaxID=160404 RepID=UPI00248EEC07|nr:HAMP domain-containing sensor histidine kinase [Anaerotignum lactatifermentans]
MNGEKDTVIQNIGKNKGISLRLRITLLVSLLLLVLNGVLVGYSVYSGGQYFTQATMALKVEMSAIKPSAEGTEAQTIQSWQEVPLEMQAVSTEPAAVAISTLQEANTGFRQEILLAFLFVDIVGILLTYFVAGRALQPLTKLSAKMAQMDENNWNCAMTEPDTHDEIGQVSESFRHLMERLQESFQAQKHFAANAAHELKTPLAVMKSAIQVLHLEEKPSAEEYEETLQLCLETTEQLSQMVEELLVISNPKEEAKEEISLKKMTEEIFQKYAAQIQEKDLVVWQQIQQDTWYTHPVLMRFLLENLLSNAVKYNQQGGSIRLTAEIKENQLHLEVADTGIGISPEHLPHIFTCFYRADPSRNKEIAGNGLGLSIVKTAVEKMQGEITVESQEGKGTCFHVTLPA